MDWIYSNILYNPHGFLISITNNKYYFHFYPMSIKGVRKELVQIFAQKCRYTEKTVTRNTYITVLNKN